MFYTNSSFLAYWRPSG